MPQTVNQMKSVTRKSITEDFEFHCCDPVPDIPTGGARVKVLYAGACYSDEQVIRSGQRRPRMPGVQDTSLFPGFEVSGIVDAICETVSQTSNILVGDRVAVFPTTDEEQTGDGYAEYIVVKDVHQLIPIPDGMALDVACMLPCGGLMAYSAVLTAKPFVQDRLENNSGIVNVLIVGAGGLSLWTLKLANHYIGDHGSKVHIVVADSSIEKLELAKEEGCYDVIEWRDDLHEEYIAMRIRNVCSGGVDVVIDFASSARTVSRGLNALKERGVLIVGGNSKYEVPINLHSLAMKSQQVLGVHRGTREQLKDLVDLVANGQITPPKYTTYSVDQANTVFKRLSQGKLSGRAVFNVFNEGDDSVFFHSSHPHDFHHSSFDLENGYCSSPDCIHRPSPGFKSQCSAMSEGTPVDVPIFTL